MVESYLFCIFQLFSKLQIQEYITFKRIPSNLPLRFTQKLEKNYLTFKTILERLNFSETTLYEHIRIGASKNNNFKLNVRSAFLKKIMGHDFKLNACQAAVLELVKIKNNILICTPTGSGKTIMALFFILNELGYDLSGTNNDMQTTCTDSIYDTILSIKSTVSERIKCDNKMKSSEFEGKTISTMPAMHLSNDGNQNNVGQIDNHIIIYLSPLKSLCIQIYDFFCKKLSGRACVNIFTSDHDLSHSQIIRSNLIIATPEKIDGFLRKNMLFIQLLIIDEIHILNSDRGAIVEALISRLIGSCRMLGMSATIPNMRQISTFLEAKSVYFDETYRTVPLELNLIKPKTHLENKDHGNTVTKQILSDLLKSIQGRTIVFIRQRKDVEEYYKCFAEELNCKCFYHHAGLPLPEKIKTEKSFIHSASKSVLFSTSTLAWGINLPADNVIVFDQFTDYDIMQMIGRAGREEYHGVQSSAKAFFITEDVNRLDFICNLQDIKSHITDLKDIYLTNLFLRTESAFEKTLFFHEQQQDTTFIEFEEISFKEQEMSDGCLKAEHGSFCSPISSTEKKYLDDDIGNQEKNSISSLNDETAYSVAKRQKIGNAMNPTNETKKVNSYNKTYHMYNNIIRSLIDEKLIFLHNDRLMLSAVAIIGVIYNINYKTIQMYYHKIANFRTEEEIFVLLSHLEIHEVHDNQDIFPTDTRVGKYIQHYIVNHKAIDDTIRIILKHLRALFHLSNEKRTARGSKQILQILYMIENNIRKDVASDEMCRNRKKKFTLVNNDPIYERHFFISDPLDNFLFFYQKQTNTELILPDMDGIFLVCEIDNNGKKTDKIMRLGSQKGKSHAFNECHKIHDNPSKKMLEHHANFENFLCVKSKYQFFIFHNRQIFIISNYLQDRCLLPILSQHYTAGHEGEGVIIFSDKNDWKIYTRTKTNPQSYYFTYYLQNNDAKQYDWCLIAGTRLNHSNNMELYAFEYLLLINSRVFYILSDGFSGSLNDVQDFEQLKIRYNIRNVFSLMMIETTKEHYTNL